LAGAQVDVAVDGAHGAGGGGGRFAAAH
jgi:hypothetical protein